MLYIAVSEDTGSWPIQGTWNLRSKTHLFHLHGMVLTTTYPSCPSAFLSAAQRFLSSLLIQSRIVLKSSAPNLVYSLGIKILLRKICSFFFWLRWKNNVLNRLGSRRGRASSMSTSSIHILKEESKLCPGHYEEEQISLLTEEGWSTQMQKGSSFSPE